MRLRQIEVFYAVYTSGSMTNAATLLNVSQPSVSKVLAHAEQQLGYPLFDRTRGKLVATPEAHQLFQHVSDVYKDVDRLRHVARNLRSANSGRIRVAAIPAFGLEVLPRAIASFRREHDNVVFEVETLHMDEINNALIESRIDVGLAFDPIVNPGIGAETLARGRFFVLAPADSPFRDGQPVTAKDLCDYPFIALNNRGPLGRRLSTHLENSGVEFNIAAWSETYHVARSLVACGVGVTIADSLTALATPDDGVKVMPLEPDLRFDIAALHLASAPHSLSARHFADHLESALQHCLARA